MARTLVSYRGEPIEHLKQSFLEEALEQLMLYPGLKKITNPNYVVDAEARVHEYSEFHDSFVITYKVWFSNGDAWQYYREYK